MKLKLAVVVCVVMLSAMAWVRAQEQPAEAAKPEQRPRARLTQPWSKLSSLTDEQKTKIREIRAAANAKVKEVRAQEEADILALLTDEQKAELKTLQEQADADRKAKSADHTPAAQ